MNENGVWIDIVLLYLLIDIVLLCLLVMLGSYLLYGLLSANAPIDGWINGDDEND